jgi:hypothetical protein
LDNSPFFPVSFDFFCTVLEFMLVLLEMSSLTVEPSEMGVRSNQTFLKGLDTRVADGVSTFLVLCL